jgi:hypothetical protein
LLAEGDSEIDNNGVSKEKLSGNLKKRVLKKGTSV